MTNSCSMTEDVRLPADVCARICCVNCQHCNPERPSDYADYPESDEDADDKEPPPSYGDALEPPAYAEDDA